jgi:hypothetical protein
MPAEEGQTQLVGIPSAGLFSHLPIAAGLPGWVQQHYQAHPLWSAASCAKWLATSSISCPYFTFSNVPICSRVRKIALQSMRGDRHKVQGSVMSNMQ